jgi:PAS domain S-box-containing protein
MNATDPPGPPGLSGEISALIATLHETGKRLEELTAGEVDAVADRDGRTFLLRHAQERLRDSAAARLAASESRFRGLIENLTDVILLIGPDGALTYVSPSMKELGGYEPEELVGRPFLELMHPEDVPLAIERNREIMHSPGRPVRMERRYRHKDGSWRTLESVTRNMLHLPELGGLVVTVRDITERRQAEDVLARRAVELERFHRLSVGRELQMVALKKEINALAVQTGREPPYTVGVPAEAAGRDRDRP